MVDLSDLAAPFPQSAIRWRVQGKPYERNGTYSAMALAYIDARDVQDRLDEVCGMDGWQTVIEETPSGRVLCRLGIYSQDMDEWIWKADGAGATDVEGDKGAISDALKRAAVQWGIGRYLYDLDSPWVRCEVRKNGDRVAWKKWAEDPWSKVKGASAPAPQNVRDPNPEPIPAAIRDRIKQRILAADTLPDLRLTWSCEKDALAWLGENMPPMLAQLTKLKDDRKNQIIGPDTAGQAPAEEHVYG